MQFRNPGCVVAKDPTIPKRRRGDENAKKPEKHFSRIYKRLLLLLDGYLQENMKVIPTLDERQLNQAISTVYELERCDLLQGRKLKIFISPESREYVEKCFFCDEKDVQANFVSHFLTV